MTALFTPTNIFPPVQHDICAFNSITIPTDNYQGKLFLAIYLTKLGVYKLLKRWEWERWEVGWGESYKIALRP